MESQRPRGHEIDHAPAKVRIEFSQASLITRRLWRIYVLLLLLRGRSVTVNKSYVVAVYVSVSACVREVG